MKTAMQELIDELDFFKNILWKSDKKNESILVKDIIRKAVLKLEKEKEQIIETFDNGIYIGTYAVDKDGEEYYNQTYNQTNVGNDGFEFDNSSTIPPPKTNNLSKH
jgi:hypothetical protein